MIDLFPNFMNENIANQMFARIGGKPPILFVRQDGTKLERVEPYLVDEPVTPENVGKVANVHIKRMRAEGWALESFHIAIPYDEGMDVIAFNGENMTAECYHVHHNLNAKALLEPTEYSEIINEIIDGYLADISDMTAEMFDNDDTDNIPMFNYTNTSTPA